MSDREEKKKLTLEPTDAARLLRELAEKLESGTLKVGVDEVVPQGALKAKVSGKSKEGVASFTLKLKWGYDPTGEAEVPSAAGKMETSPDTEKTSSYKRIKKRLSSTFKKIRAQLREGAIPDTELAELFDQDAEKMLLYPKKGEMADIVVFREMAASFTAAVKAGDHEAAVREAAALAAAEKRCHKRYK